MTKDETIRKQEIEIKSLREIINDKADEITARNEIARLHGIIEQTTKELQAERAKVAQLRADYGLVCDTQRRDQLEAERQTKRADDLQALLTAVCDIVNAKKK